MTTVKDMEVSFRVINEAAPKFIEVAKQMKLAVDQMNRSMIKLGKMLRPRIDQVVTMDDGVTRRVRIC
jgi:hypothetical protein